MGRQTAFDRIALILCAIIFSPEAFHVLHMYTSITYVCTYVYALTVE